MCRPLHGGLAACYPFAAMESEEIISSLRVTERVLKGFEPETVRRTLSYEGDALAEVYVEDAAKDCIIAWPVMTGVDLNDIFEAYRDFAGDTQTSLEWWIGNRFFEQSLRGQEVQSAARELRAQEERTGWSLDLVQLVCPHSVLEVTFGPVDAPAQATRLAALVPSVSERLLTLFSRFHRNELIRKHPEIPYVAFSAALGQGFQMLRTGAASG